MVGNAFETAVDAAIKSGPKTQTSKPDRQYPRQAADQTRRAMNQAVFTQLPPALGEARMVEAPMVRVRFPCSAPLRGWCGSRPA
jgi:hypothetical protein